MSTGTKKPSDQEQSGEYTPDRNPGEENYESLTNRYGGAEERDAAEERAKDGAAKDEAGNTDFDKELADLNKQEGYTPGDDSGDPRSREKSGEWEMAAGQNSDSGGEKKGSKKKWIAGGGGVLGLITLLTGGYFGLHLSLISIVENLFDFNFRRSYTLTAFRGAKNTQSRLFANPDEVDAKCNTRLCTFRYGRGGSRSEIQRMGRSTVVDEVIYRDRDGNRYSTKPGEERGPRGKRYFVERAILTDGTELDESNYKEQFKNNRLVKRFHVQAFVTKGKYSRTKAQVAKIGKLFSRKGPRTAGDDNDRPNNRIRKALFRAFLSDPPDPNAPARDYMRQLVRERIGSGVIDKADGLKRTLIDNPNARVEAFLEGKIREPGRNLRNRLADKANSSAEGFRQAEETAKEAAGRVGNSINLIGTTCAIRAVINTFGLAVKYYRMAGLVQYTGQFLAYAGKMKAGNALPADETMVTPEGVGAMASLLLTPNEEGQTFFDSPGYQHLLYGTQPSEGSIAEYSLGLSSQDGIFGQAYNKIATLEENLSNVGQKTIDTVCGIALSPAGIITGIVLTVASLGGSPVATAAKLGAGVAASLLLSRLIVKATESLAKDMAGAVADGDTDSYDRGNILAAGTSALSSQMGRSQGLHPMKEGELAALDKTVDQTYPSLFPQDRPSLTEKVATNVGMFSLQVAGGLVNLGGIFMPQKLFASARADHSLSKAYAVRKQEANSKTCTDPSLEGYATTPYCTLIYGAKTDTLIDNPDYNPRKVADWMWKNKHIRFADGEAPEVPSGEDSGSGSGSDSCRSEPANPTDYPVNSWDLVEDGKLYYEIQDSRIKSAIEFAANEWGSFGCIEIAPAPDGEQANLSISVGAVEGSSHARSYYSSTGTGRIVFEPRVLDYSQRSRRGVAVHEIGHTLRFDHPADLRETSDAPLSTMNTGATLGGENDIASVTNYDCKLYKAIWGGDASCGGSGGSSGESGGEDSGDGGGSETPEGMSDCGKNYTGFVYSEDYCKYIEVCMDGLYPLVKTPIDGVHTGDYNNTLDYCSANGPKNSKNGPSDKYIYFRLFRMDGNIIEPASAVDDEFYSSGQSGGGSSGPSAPSGELAWPVGGDKGAVGNCYGYNKNYVNFGGYHYGFDIFSSQGTPIYAGADGEVIASYYKAGTATLGPNYVAINHPDMGIATGYAHMASRDVEVGDKVKQGDKIGTMGTNQGTHLHITAQPEGVKAAGAPKGSPDYNGKSFNPAKFLTKPGEVNYIYNAKAEGGCDELGNG